MLRQNVRSAKEENVLLYELNVLWGAVDVPQIRCRMRTTQHKQTNKQIDGGMTGIEETNKSEYSHQNQI